jgi:hypothetical protein
MLNNEAVVGMGSRASWDAMCYVKGSMLSSLGSLDSWDVF